MIDFLRGYLNRPLPLHKICVFLSAILAANYANAQVSGTVFRDFNSNGTKDNTATFNEVGLAGITVTAYNPSGAPIGSDISAADGTYNIAGASGAVRVEFTGWQTGDFPSFAGGTSVQFVTAPIAGVNFGVNYPMHYSSTENPNMATDIYVNGNPLGGGTSGTERGFVTFDYNSTGDGTGDPDLTTFPLDPVTYATQTSETGPLWGLGYQRTTQRLFAAAFIKRHQGIGPLGEGGIYVFDYSGGATPTLSNFVDVATIGINVGTVGVGATPTDRNINRGLSNNATTASPSGDPQAFDAVGKVGIGGLTVSEDDKKLWFINLFDQKLYSIVIDSDNNPATPPTAADVASFSLPANPCSAGTLRPFAVNAYRSDIYVGAVCDAALESFIYKFDGTTFTPVLVSGQAAIPLTYNKGSVTVSGNCNPDTNDGWFNWFSVPPTPCDNTNPDHFLYAAPTPILSDIEFDVDGSMILGYTDRTGHQFGAENTQYDGAGMETAHSGGDILRVCLVNGNYYMEGSPECPSNVSNTQGPSGGEYYYQDFFDNPDYNGLLHEETSSGGLTLLPGKGEVATSAFDPFATAFLSGGVNWFNNTTGTARNYGYMLYFGTSAGVSPSGHFSKAIGVGDIELLVDPAPLEIGNRVWTDTDGDGIQDAGEAGIDGIVVEIYNGTTLVGTTTTDALGQWYFNDSNVTLNGATGLEPNTAYTIRVPSASFPSGQPLTTTNNDGTTNGDVRDSDATLVGGNAEIAYTTGGIGQNDHTLDIGFRSMPPDLSLTKAVNTAVSTIGGTVTFTLTLTNDNGIDATGVVVTDYLPTGVTFVSTSDPANASLVGNNVVWNVGTFLGTDAPKTLTITVIANGEGSFINNAEITATNEGDADSTPNNDVTGEDDQDQACFSVPVSLCSDSPTATITVTAAAASSYLWYVSTDGGVNYTSLGQTTQTLVIDNTLMGGNGVTKYFKAAYNGAAITGACGDVMCCPIIVTTQTCTVCPPPKCISITVTKH